MALKRVAALLASSAMLLLVACDDPKTIEGTIWTKDARGTLSKLPSVEVRLLNPAIRTALQRHLKSFDEREDQAVAKSLETAIATAVSDAEVEKAKNQRQLAIATDETIAIQSELDVARIAEAKQIKISEVESSQLRSQLTTLGAKADTLRRRIEEQRNFLVTEQAKLDIEYNEQKSRLETVLSQAKSELERNQLAKETFDVAVSSERSQLAEQFARNYVRDKIVVTHSFTQKYRHSNDYYNFCFSIQNVGTKAVLSVRVQVTINNNDISDRQFRDLFEPVYTPRKWEIVPSTLEVKNRYSETVHGLTMGQSWPAYVDDACFKTKMAFGDRLRTWEALGGLRPEAARIRITEATLSDPKLLEEAGKYSVKEWRYRALSVEDVFRDEIDASKPASNEQQEQLTAAIKRSERRMQEASQLLQGLKRVVATNRVILDAEAELGLVTENEGAVRQGIELHVAQLGPFTKARASAEQKLASAQEHQAKLRGLVNKSDAILLSMKSKQGDIFEGLKVQARDNLDLTSIASTWVLELLEMLESADGVSIRSDIDGRFRFEKVSMKLPILFSVAREEKRGGQDRETSYRNSRYFWIDTVDTSKTTLHDLGDFNSDELHLKKFDAIQRRVATVSGAKLGNR